MIDVRKFVKTLEGKPVAVFGLGLSNMAAIKALAAAGADVRAWDDNEGRRKQAEDAGAELYDMTQEPLDGFACLVLAPGVPLYHPKPHPVVKKARTVSGHPEGAKRPKDLASGYEILRCAQDDKNMKGIEILCDLEILHRCGHGRKTIGITGTNGKSTTTALLGHVLNECGIKAAVGGNIGTAALALDLPPEGGVIVLEISSFQMDLCPSFTPDIAVHMNFSPDHLDRHGDMAGYIAAKRRMFEGAGAAVIGIDDEDSRTMFESVKKAGQRAVYPVSYRDKGVAVLSSAALPGDHNKQNMAAVYRTARLMGLAGRDIIAAIETFPGLPHRQYPVRTIGRVLYVNDSKATNAAAAEKALASYEDIFWIAGGRAKEGGLSGLAPYTGAVRHVFLIGEAADDFSLWCAQNGMPCTICGTLEKAADAAYKAAQSYGRGTVLLSPACASFDQFSSFEERGNIFADIIHRLKDIAA